MKNLIIIVVILVTNAVFGQDYSLLIDINKYRQANGFNSLAFDENTYNTCKKETQAKCFKNGRIDKFKFWVKHNGVPKDSVSFNRFLKHNNVNVKEFNRFLVNYYNIKYKITKESDVTKYILLYVVYDIDRKAKLKKQILTPNITRASVNVIVDKTGVCYGFNLN